MPLVEHYACQMGVCPTKINITSAKRVFGRCTSKKHLNFSFRLALCPYEAIEYVVVHELCHIKEMNHSKRFWAEVEKILPDYKLRRRLLKEKI
jgi:predicted metal-dependent hydrolase